MTVRYLVSSTVIICAIGACVGKDSVSRTVTVRDSMGIQIVKSEAPQHPKLAVASQPLFEIPNDFDAPDHYLFDVNRAVQFSDGRIVVGNSGTFELYYFGSDGDFLFSRGGQGDGPGELQRLYQLAVCDGGQLAVMENARLSFFDIEGESVRVVRVPGHLADGRATLVGLSPDCESALLVAGLQEPPPPGETVFESLFLLHWATLTEGVRDTVGIISAGDAQAYVRNGQRHTTRRPYGREAVWAASGGDAILGLAFDFEFHRIDRRGTLTQIVRWAAPPEPVTDADWDYFVRDREEMLRLYPDEARFGATLDDFSVPSHKPPYSNLVVDDRDRLWLQRYGQSGYGTTDPSADWWVFGPDGEWLAEITIPEGLEVLSIGNDRVVGIALDSLDLQSVRVFKLPEELNR